MNIGYLRVRRVQVVTGIGEERSSASESLAVKVMTGLSRGGCGRVCAHECACAADMRAAVAVAVEVAVAVAVAICLHLHEYSLRRAAARRLPLRTIKPSPCTIFSGPYRSRAWRTYDRLRLLVHSRV
jgi:hypothetical protein